MIVDPDKIFLFGKALEMFLAVNDGKARIPEYDNCTTCIGGKREFVFPDGSVLKMEKINQADYKLIK